MREFHGLETLCGTQQGLLRTDRLANLLMADLAEARLVIYGKNQTEQPIVLAILAPLSNSMQYDNFDQRLDLVFTGEIIANSSPALTYCLQGQAFSVTGRCSTIPKVCGVDLYLSRSYSGKIGDIARQSFSIAVKTLKQQLQP